MVAIDNAKRIIKEQYKAYPVSNKMIFVCNAGTGKMTTAKLFSEMRFIWF